MPHLRHAFADTALGTLLVAATEAGVCLVALDDARPALRAELGRRFPGVESAEVEPAGAFADWFAAVVALTADPSRGVEVPLDVGGTPFQGRVWDELRAVPAGATVSYARLAARLGVAGGARAVAGACAANRVALLVPCHRVVRGDGSVSGYRWGAGRKAELLRLEAALTPAAARL